MRFPTFDLSEFDLQALSGVDLAPVDVAVIDSGIDSSHPDLVGRIASSRRFRLDGDVVVRDEIEVGGDNDAYGHGTAVAGIIASLAPNARIHDFRVLEMGNQGTGMCLLEGLVHAVAMRCKVVNMSLAVASKFSEALSAICETAYYQGQIVVAAKRNLPIHNLGLPAEFSSTISVDCFDVDDPWRISFQGGSRIEFVARGEKVATAAKGGGYTTLSGTSFATPVISAQCAVLAGRFPDLLPFEAKSLLKLHSERNAANETVPFGARTPEGTSNPCANESQKEIP